MSQLKKYFQKKRINIKRVYVANKLDREVKIAKSILQDRYKRKYGKRRILTYQATTDAVADRIKELRQNGIW